MFFLLPIFEIAQVILILALKFFSIDPIEITNGVAVRGLSID
jgi:hypothetical protein